MRKSVVNSIFGKAAVVALCVSFFMLAVIAFALMSPKSPEAHETAYAAAGDPPLISKVEVVPYKNGEVYDLNGRCITMNLTDGSKWHSTLPSDINDSFFGKFGLLYTISDYEYRTIRRFWSDDGKTPATGVNTQNGSEPVPGTTRYASMMADGEITVSAITVSGTTWYGENVSNLNILENNGRNVVAGKYTVNSITLSYTFEYEYIKQGVTDVINVTGSGAGTALPEVRSYATTTYTVSNIVSDVSELNIKLFLTSDINVNLTQADTNLNMTPVYDSTTQWFDRVMLFDPSVEGSAANLNLPDYFYYSFANGARKPFIAQYGVSSGVNNKTFGVETSLKSGGDPIAYYLKLVWYFDANMDLMCDASETVGAGTYYMHIEGSESDDGFYCDEYESSSGKKENALNFLYGGADYVQSLTVNRSELKISVKDELGLSAERGEDGRISLPFGSQYTMASLFASQINQSIPGGEYYEYDQATNSYTYTVDTRFNSAKDYYVKKASADGVFSNLTESYSLAETAWADIGGYDNDKNYVIGSPSPLFSFKGSYFPGSDICDYDYAVVYFSIGIGEIARNYTFDFGEYSGGTWKSYSVDVETGKTGLIEEGKAKTGDSAMKSYYYYDSFSLTPPVVTVDISDFRTTVTGAAYGEVWNSSEIDFSSVKLTGPGLTPADLDGNGYADDATYDLSTALEKWRVRIIGSAEERQLVGDYNYIFVLMRLARVSQTTGKTAEDYEDEDGVVYTPYSQTLYAGDYFVTYSLSYMQQGSAAIIDAGTCVKGNSTVRIGDVGVATLSMNKPADFRIESVRIYLNLDEYTPNKYYDGTNEVKKSAGSDLAATAELRQVTGGTVSPTLIALGYKSVLEYDLAVNIRYIYSIFYSSAMASDENQLDIGGEVSIAAKGGLTTDEYNSILASYEIEQGLRRNDLEETLLGYINRRTLELRVLKDPDRITDESDPNYSRLDYSRSYNSDTYVAIRVARYYDKNAEGVTLRSLYGNTSLTEITAGKEYYADYYLFYNQDNNTEEYRFYADLPGIFENRCYILLEIADDSTGANYGFLNTDEIKEYFAWDTTDGTTLMFNSNRETGAYVPVNTYSFIDWENALMADPFTGVYGSTVFSRESFAGLYKLAVTDGIVIMNYNLVLRKGVTNETVNGEEIGMEITKIVLQPEDVFDFQGEDADKGRVLVYDKTNKIGLVYYSDLDKSFVLIYRHDEYEKIRTDSAFLQADGSSNFMSLITVIGFSIGGETETTDDDRIYDVSEFTSDILNMRLAGDYILEVRTPETQNYKEVTAVTEIRIYCAQVTVYSTAAIRTYMAEYDSEKEVKGDVSDAGKKLLTATELEQYVAYMDVNTYELYATDEGNLTKTYIYYKNDDPSVKLYDTSLIRLYYVGFAAGDGFVRGVDREAVVTVDTSCFVVGGEYVDQAGRKIGAVQLGGAYKQNYSFNYVASDLFVKKQTLLLEMEGNQNTSYTGANLLPDCDVVTEDGSDAPAELTQFIAAYFALGTDGKYRIYVRDYSASGVEIEEAKISTGPADINDYYYYFVEYFDESGAPATVKEDRGNLYAIIGGISYKLYANGMAAYYYYTDNDREKAKNVITSTETIIYYDEINSNFYYYVDNDENSTKVVLTENIEPNFENTDGDAKVSYVDTVDGKNIYIAINEHDDASTLNRNVKNVFYDNDGNKGGYLLKVYASPSEAAGGSSTNYARTKTQVVIFTVEVLEIDLAEHESGEFDGTLINPVWDGEFTDSEYILREFNEYYEGTTLKNETVNLGGAWANVEVEYNSNGLPMWAYMYSTEDDFTTNKIQSFAEYEKGDRNDFINAETSEDIIKDAGLYVVLIKVTLRNSVAAAGEEPVNMRNNLRFANRTSQAKFDGTTHTPTEEYEAYFVLYLAIDRSDDIILSVNASDNVRATGETGAGYEGAFAKTYDAEALSFGENLQVLSKDSSNGEILNVRAYMSVTADYLGDSSFAYFRSEDGAIVYKWNENKFISLTHVNEFYITFIVNYNDAIEAAMEGRTATYDNNFITYTSVYKVRIEARQLSVFIKTKNPETGEIPTDPKELSYKNYGTTNESVENKFFFTFGNWAGDDENNLLNAITSMPGIDWVSGGLSTDGDVQGTRMSAGTDYYVKAMGGNEPATVITIGSDRVTYYDYAFDYSDSLKFEIKRLQLTIGGDYPCVEIDKSKPYAGVALVPDIRRYGWDGENLDNGEDAAFAKEVAYIGYIPNYDPERDDYTDADVIGTIRSAVNVGYYLFRISIGSSRNYIGIEEPFYWVFEVEKTELILEFVGENGNADRGYASMTYIGTGGAYPVFNVKYSGFMGYDDSTSNRSVQEIKFRPATIPNDGYYNGIAMLNLVNPLYVFIDAETGEELINEDGTPYLPVNAGEYYIKIVISEGEYGYADNYKIVVKYLENDGEILYPVMSINKRRVGVSFDADSNRRISKEYDGTDAVIENSVSPKTAEYAGNYSFTPQSGDIGLVSGDYISLKINYSSSRYARKNVYDEFDVMSDIDVYLLVDAALMGDDAENYEFSMAMSDTYVDGEITYVRLNGTITPARANVKFLDKDGQNVNVLRVVYNGEPQPVILKVDGVNGEVLTEENGDYTVLYSSEKTNYNSEIAPTNCDYYEVTVTIRNKNYSESPQTGYLEILRAQVNIDFGGEGVQTYGNVTDGLTAVANGVHGYSTQLSVNYYYITEEGLRGDLVPDISVAPAGTYIAEAIHVATDNFADKSAEEIFTIARRNTAINYDVAPKYKYNGGAVSIKMYFMDNGETFYPLLIFDKSVNGEWVPYNYTVSENGVIGDIGDNPSDVGVYRVKAYEYLENYFVTTPVWCVFSIEKAELTVQINDLTVNEKTDYTPSATMQGCLTSGASFSSVVQGLQFAYYAMNGTELTEKPTASGTYRVVGYGATSQNYNITYKFGILTINKAEVKAEDNALSDGVSAIFEGSFSSDTTITITKKQNTEYADMTEAFESLKKLGEDYEGKTLSEIFVFTYENYVPTQSGGGATVRLYVPKLFAGANETEALSYSVAVLASDGSVSVVNGTKDGDYLVIRTEEQVIKAVSVITEESEKENNYDWLLYVGIAIAVLVIAAAIIIVVKKA